LLFNRSTSVSFELERFLEDVYCLELGRSLAALTLPSNHLSDYTHYWNVSFSQLPFRVYKEIAKGTTSESLERLAVARAGYLFSIGISRA
jgi:hypothetical protein